MTIYTAYFSHSYDAGMLFVGNFSTREAAETAMRENIGDNVYYKPVILVSTLDVPVNKNDWEPSIQTRCNL